MRHKVALEDRFLQHREGVLKLGKDVSMVSMVLPLSSKLLPLSFLTQTMLMLHTFDYADASS